MTCANLSIDMQLYLVGQQVKWWEPDRLKDVILRSGAMHIIMSFLGCIGTLMKGSGQYTLVGSAFGGLTGIMSGKVRAMRAFRMVSAALLEGNWLFQQVCIECMLHVLNLFSAVTSIMLAISPGTCWRCGTFYLTLPRPTSWPEHMSVTTMTS